MKRSVPVIEGLEGLGALIELLGNLDKYQDRYQSLKSIRDEATEAVEKMIGAESVDRARNAARVAQQAAEGHLENAKAEAAAIRKAAVDETVQLRAETEAAKKEAHDKGVAADQALAQVKEAVRLKTAELDKREKALVGREDQVKAREESVSAGEAHLNSRISKFTAALEGTR